MMNSIIIIIYYEDHNAYKCQDENKISMENLKLEN